MPPSVEPDLPEAASRRLTGGAWSSGLSVSDFAAGLEMGLEPLGFVQGYAVLQWSTYMGAPMGMGRLGMTRGAWWGQGQSGRYVEQWPCPHGFVSAEHRMYGANVEQTLVESTWAAGWNLARSRMVEEAAALGAHGVVNVSDDVQSFVGPGTVEFGCRGTAVCVPGSRTPPAPFTTYLSGQRLAKLFEAGFAPVSVVAAFSSVQMIGSCITHYQLAGTQAGTWYGPGAGGTAGVAPIAQVNRAHAAVRRLVRERIRAQLGSDMLQGASLEESEREIGEGDFVVESLLKGNRVRRFKDVDPLPGPIPVVPLT